MFFGLKRSAPDPADGQPLSKKAGREAAPPGSSKNMQYQLFSCINSIPASLKSRAIAKCSLEFLVAEKQSDAGSEFGRSVCSATSDSRSDYSTRSECNSDLGSTGEEGYEYILNHCLIRLTFQNVQGKATQYSPAGARGVTIDCYFNGRRRGQRSPANILVKTFTHQGAHRFAQKVMDVPVRKRINNRNPTLGEFLKDIQEKKMVPVAFTIDEIGAQGCRDWT